MHGAPNMSQYVTMQSINMPPIAGLQLSSRRAVPPWEALCQRFLITVHQKICLLTLLLHSSTFILLNAIRKKTVLSIHDSLNQTVVTVYEALR